MHFKIIIIILDFNVVKFYKVKHRLLNSKLIYTTVPTFRNKLIFCFCSFLTLLVISAHTSESEKDGEPRNQVPEEGLRVWGSFEPNSARNCRDGKHSGGGTHLTPKGHSVGAMLPNHLRELFICLCLTIWDLINTRECLTMWGCLTLWGNITLWVGRSEKTLFAIFI